MTFSRGTFRVLAVSGALFAAACSDAPQPTDPAVQQPVPQFSRAQGNDWFTRVTTEGLALEGAVYVDLDEATNRVRIGVEHGNAENAMRGVVARLGIPAGAVDIVRAEPIHQVATLRDLIRPVTAGLQIHFSRYVCSIGFNATLNGVSSFVTASHCTTRQGGTEGTLYYQPSSSIAGSFIGTEADDPAYFTGGICPKGKKCRYADAARVAYAAGIDADLGGIAMTTGQNNGSLTHAGTINITAENNSGGAVGSTAHKVGRTTGWTSGPITNTCVNTAVSGSKILLLCQTFVSAGVGGGDSGSDVFAYSGGNATLLGVLWGGNSAGTQFVFSPLGQVRQELGNLVVR